jgi:uncharacterized protein with ACT and thioredoxin-like domain
MRGQEGVWNDFTGKRVIVMGGSPAASVDQLRSAKASAAVSEPDQDGFTIRGDWTA